MPTQDRVFELIQQIQDLALVSDTGVQQVEILRGELSNVDGTPLSLTVNIKRTVHQTSIPQAIVGKPTKLEVDVRLVPVIMSENAVWEKLVTDCPPTIYSRYWDSDVPVNVGDSLSVGQEELIVKKAVFNLERNQKLFRCEAYYGVTDSGVEKASTWYKQLIFHLENTGWHKVTKIK